MGDAPCALLLARLHVLAGDEGEQPHCVGLFVAELHLLEGGDDGPGVAHEGGDEGGLGLGVVPGAHRLAGGVVVVGRHLHGGGLGHQPAHPTDGCHQLGHGVLGRHRVVEQCRVQRPAPAPRQHAGGADHLRHRLADALGPRAAIHAGVAEGDRWARRAAALADRFSLFSAYFA